MTKFQLGTREYVETSYAAADAVELTDLTPDTHNARRHDERNLALIEAALREVGATRSVVVDETGTILRSSALQRLSAA
jgi:hypothetical protein